MSLSIYTFMQDLEDLKEGEYVYKLHGKVLVRQDLTEAKNMVSSRLKLIQGERYVRHIALS